MADDPKPDPKPAKGDDPKPDPDDLGEAGKKALDKERVARREAEKQAKDLADRLAAIEDKDKSEVERLTAKAADAEKRASDAEAKVLRFEVAAEKGVKAKWLTGASREELEAAADEYLTEHPPAGDGKGGGPPAKPTEELKGGGDPDAAGEPTTEDVRTMVAEIPRGGF